MSRSFAELTDDTSASGWIPTESFIDKVLDGVVCHGQLSGKVTAVNYDLAAGNGDTVNVPYITARTHSCVSNSACNCLSATSTTFSNYPIEIAQWGDYDLICDFTAYKTIDNITAKIMNEMAKRIAKCRDSEIWLRLVNGPPQIDVETGVVCTDEAWSSCCTYQYNLYNSIVTVQKSLQGAAYNPDTIVMHPSVAKFLYFRDGGSVPATANMLPGVKTDGNGQVTEILGMKLIESCNATVCSGDSGAVMAVVFDSSRTVGEAWGMRPKFNQFYDGKCNRTELTMWTYWGCASLDNNAKGWISNP